MTLVLELRVHAVPREKVKVCSFVMQVTQLNGPSHAQKIHCDKILFSHTRR